MGRGVGLLFELLLFFFVLVAFSSGNEKSSALALDLDASDASASEAPDQVDEQEVTTNNQEEEGTVEGDSREEEREDDEEEDSEDSGYEESSAEKEADGSKEGHKSEEFEVTQREEESDSDDNQDSNFIEDLQAFEGFDPLPSKDDSIESQFAEDAVEGLSKKAEAEAEAEVEKEAEVVVDKEEKAMDKVEKLVEKEVEKEAEQELDNNRKRIQKEATEIEKQVEKEEDKKDQMAEKEVENEIEKEVEGAEKGGEPEGPEEGEEGEEGEGAGKKERKLSNKHPTGFHYLGRGYNTVSGNPAAMGTQRDPGVRGQVFKFFWKGKKAVRTTPVPFTQLQFEESAESSPSKEESQVDAPAKDAEDPAINASKDPDLKAEDPALKASKDPDTEKSTSTSKDPSDPQLHEKQDPESQDQEPAIYNEAEIPDGVDFYFQPRCGFEANDLVQISSKKSLQKELIHSVDMPTEFIPSAFTRSSSMAVLDGVPSSSSRVIILQRSQCLAYRVVVQDEALKGGQIGLHPQFLYSIKIAIDSNDWRDFIIQYGTAFVHDMDVGGLFLAETRTTVKKLFCEEKKKEGEPYPLTLPKATSPRNPTEAEKNLRALGTTKTIYKGGKRTKKVDWDAWEKKLWQHYSAVNLVLKPMWTIFDYPILFTNHIKEDLSKIQERLKTEILHYLKSNSIPVPEEIPPPYHQISCNKGF